VPMPKPMPLTRAPSTMPHLDFTKKSKLRATKHHEGHHEGTHGQEETERADAGQCLGRQSRFLHLHISHRRGRHHLVAGRNARSAERSWRIRPSRRISARFRARWRQSAPSVSSALSAAADVIAAAIIAVAVRIAVRSPRQSWWSFQNAAAAVVVPVSVSSAVPAGQAVRVIDRGHQGGHHGPSRRPQLISEMLKAGQDVVHSDRQRAPRQKGRAHHQSRRSAGSFSRVHAHHRSHRRLAQNRPAPIIARACAASSAKRVAAIPAASSCAPRPAAPPTKKFAPDIEFLGTTWNEIKERSEQRKAPSLLHRDLKSRRTHPARLRQRRISPPSGSTAKKNSARSSNSSAAFSPSWSAASSCTPRKPPIFEEFGIQHELDKALRAKVWLKSGGYIVINHTEALVAIDVKHRQVRRQRFHSPGRHHRQKQPGSG